MSDILPRQKPSKVRIVVRELFCIFLWVYASVKLFVFDFDVYLTEQYAPSLTWVINFKFFFLLILIAVYWITVGDKNFFKSLGFLFIYPFFVLFWRIPKLFFKNWMAVFAAAAFLTSFVRSLKRNFISFTLFSISSVIILFSDNVYLLILSIVTLFILLVVHLLKKFYYSFTPSKALGFPKKNLVKLLDESRKQFALPEELKSTELEKYTEAQKKTWAQNLQMLLLINRGSTFLAAKLKDFQESRMIFIYFLLGILVSLITTVTVFALINLGLHKVDPSQFSSLSPRGFGFFLYYSFNTLVTNGIGDFYPVGGIAQLLETVEIIFGIFILVILWSLYTSVKNEKTREEVDSVIFDLNKQGNELELFINKEFSLDLEQAFSEIEKIPGNFLTIIYYFTTKKK